LAALHPDRLARFQRFAGAGAAFGGFDLRRNRLAFHPVSHRVGRRSRLLELSLKILLARRFVRATRAHHRSRCRNRSSVDPPPPHILPLLRLVQGDKKKSWCETFPPEMISTEHRGSRVFSTRRTTFTGAGASFTGSGGL